MRSVDRMFCALFHEETDKVPYFDFFTTPVAMERFLGEELKQISDPKERMLAYTRFFDNDAVSLGLLGWHWFLGEELIAENDECIRTQTAFGAQKIVHKKPYFIEYTSFPVKSQEDLDRLKPPDPELFKERILSLAEYVESWTKTDYFIILGVDGPFCEVQFALRGMAQFLTDIVKDPVFAEREIEFVAKPFIEVLKMILEALPVHGIVVLDDLGITESLQIPPKAYREIIMPYHKAMVKTCHKMGTPVGIHSHGNINLILRDIVEAGFDFINPLEPSEHMNLAEIKEKFGDRVSIIGGISRFIGTMSRKEIFDHVADRIKIGAPGGGFVLSSAGGVPHDMPQENLDYYRKNVRSLRNYPKRLQ